jgi:hypothetical protein
VAEIEAASREAPNGPHSDPYDCHFGNASIASAVRTRCQGLWH